MKNRGASGGGARWILRGPGPEPRIPALEGGLELFVEHLRARLQQQMGTSTRPLPAVHRSWPAQIHGTVRSTCVAQGRSMMRTDGHVDAVRRERGRLGGDGTISAGQGAPPGRRGDLGGDAHEDDEEAAAGCPTVLQWWVGGFPLLESSTSLRCRRRHDDVR
jgi:hypothetical protein